jgi:hypothetical protein
MNLTEYLAAENLNASQFARQHNLPAPRLYEHLKWEQTGGTLGRPIGGQLSLKIETISGGRMTFADLRPDYVLNEGEPSIQK